MYLKLVAHSTCSDKHMHHSSATLCRTRRQLPAQALSATLGHSQASTARRVGHARHPPRAEDALSRHPPRAECPAALGGLDPLGTHRSQSRPARHASKQGRGWRGWAAAGAASTGCWQLQLPAATCRAVIAAARRQADAAVRVSAAYPAPGV